jgi:serine protease
MRKLMLLPIAGLFFGCGNSTQPTKTVVLHDTDPAISEEILVDLKDNVSDQDVIELSRLAGTNLHTRNKVAEQYKYEVGTIHTVDEADVFARLKQDPRVEHVEPMVVYKALYTPNDPMMGDQWGMKRIGAESAWNMSCGQGVVVAILDTGVSCSLSDSAVKCGGGQSFANDSSSDDTEDRHSHGSHVAGTVAQATNNGLGTVGLAYCASIMPVKVLTDEGFGSNEGISEGIRWATDNGANVINMSLGGPFPSDVIEDAVNYAHDHGVSVICAAGNSGGPVGFPAAFDNSIAVSALDKNDNLAHFSSRGPQVAISAAGVDVLQQTIGGDDGKGEFKKFSGTSMSSPSIAAEAALIYSSGITAPDAVKAKMQSTADPKDDREKFGAGIARADVAVRSTFLWHTGLRLLALFGILFFMRKMVKTSSMKNGLTIAGVVVSCFGLVPLVFSGLLPHTGAFRTVVELLARPLGEWDIVAPFLPSHKYLMLLNFLPAGALTLLTLGNKYLRKFSLGFALGSAALCTQVALSGDTYFFGGGLLLKVFMGVSIVACGWLAKQLFEKDTATS